MIVVFLCGAAVILPEPIRNERIVVASEINLPSGSLIAFSSDNRNQLAESTHYDIWTLDPIYPTNLRQLTNTTEDDLMSVWSPDGDKIVFARYFPYRIGHNEYASLWVIDKDGPIGSEAMILDWWFVGGGGIQPYFWYTADDGDRIYYMKDPGGSCDFYWIYANGEPDQAENLVMGGESICQADLSPDGNSLVFNYYGNAALYTANFIVDQGTTRIENITPFIIDFDIVSHPHWSPDGNQISFGRFYGSGEDVYVVDVLNQESPRQITESNNSWQNSWSPDSNWIVTSEFGGIAFYPINIITNPKNLLADDGIKDIFPDWSPFFSTEKLTNTSFETYIPIGWQDGRQIVSTEGPDCGFGNAHTGNCSWRFNGDGSSKRIFMRFKTPGGLKGDSFVLSIYRKGLSVPAADGAFVKAIFFYTDGSQGSFKFNLDTGNLTTWEQFTLPFVAARDYKRVKIALFYKKASGSMLLDDISLTKNGGGELLENISFETYKPDDWILAKEIVPNEGPDCWAGNSYSGSCAWMFFGDGSNKRLLRRVKHNGSAGDAIMISVIRKGLGVPDAAGAYIKVEIFYTDGTSDIKRVDLDTGDLSVWEVISQGFTATKDYKRFNLDLFYKKSFGTMWLDNISLLVP